MCNFVVTVELKDHHIDCDKMDLLMRLEGFKRRVIPPTSFRPTNVFTHPDNPRHATFEGQRDSDASELHRYLEGRIKPDFQARIEVHEAETAMYRYTVSASSSAQARSRESSIG